MAESLKRSITVADMLDIYSAPALWAAMSSAMAEPGDIVVDLGAATYAHAAALQVLVSAALTAHAQGRSFSCLGLSAEMINEFHVAGLADLLITAGTQNGEPSS